ncbi:hypothetical protein K8P10_002796 [Leucobacter sp. Psy1]|nr:hypothetical protein K8P10_002796 [Leucobacter sp. Psy1]
MKTAHALEDGVRLRIGDGRDPTQARGSRTPGKQARLLAHTPAPVFDRRVIYNALLSRELPKRSVGGRDGSFERFRAHNIAECAVWGGHPQPIGTVALRTRFIRTMPQHRRGAARSVREPLSHTHP